MTQEETIQGALLKKFPFLNGNIRIQRIRRIFAQAGKGELEGVLSFARNSLGFTMLCTITGLDEGAAFAFLYHLAREDGITLHIKTSTPKDNPCIKTITGLFPTADIYEREILDLFGVQVEGLVPGTRYPLADDWPKGEYPLRKDWKPRARGVGRSDISEKCPDQKRTEGPQKCEE